MCGKIVATVYLAITSFESFCQLSISQIDGFELLFQFYVLTIGGLETALTLTTLELSPSFLTSYPNSSISFPGILNSFLSQWDLFLGE